MQNPLAQDIFNNVNSRRSSPGNSAANNPLMIKLDRGLPNSQSRPELLRQATPDTPIYRASFRNLVAAGEFEDSPMNQRYSNSRQISQSQIGLTGPGETNSFTKHFMPSSRGQPNVVLNGSRLIDRPQQQSGYLSASPRTLDTRSFNEYGQFVRDQLENVTTTYGGVDHRRKNVKDGEARSIHNGHTPTTAKYGSSHSFTDNYQIQAQIATLKNQLNQLTSNLATCFLDEELLNQQLIFKSSSQAQTSASSYDSSMGATIKLRQHTDSKNSEAAKYSSFISDLQKKIDAGKIRKRYLLAKKLESIECKPKAESLLSEVESLKKSSGLI